MPFHIWYVDNIGMACSSHLQKRRYNGDKIIRQSIIVICTQYFAKNTKRAKQIDFKIYHIRIQWDFHYYLLDRIFNTVHKIYLLNHLSNYPSNH